MKCPGCDRENQSHYKFCLGCGRELPHGPALTDSEEKARRIALLKAHLKTSRESGLEPFGQALAARCPWCAAQLSEAGKCRHCGAPQ